MEQAELVMTEFLTLTEAALAPSTAPWADHLPRGPVPQPAMAMPEPVLVSPLVIGGAVAAAVACTGVLCLLVCFV